MRRFTVTVLTIIILIIPSTTLIAGDCGDVNNDYLVNIFDITHLISYLYMDGPEPDCSNTVTDTNGNVYQTVKIGDQWWMAENLKVTHYRNGDPIPNVTDSVEWIGLTTGAYCNYDNGTDNVATYGRLYNWYAVDDSRNIAPEGWHVPTDADWQTLIDFLGGNDVAGGEMKDTTAYWSQPNEGATNSSGFTALPGGYRYIYGNFISIGDDALFWSSTENNSNDAWYRGLYYTIPGVVHYYNPKHCGFSVRCVKD